MEESFGLSRDNVVVMPGIEISGDLKRWKPEEVA